MKNNLGKLFIISSVAGGGKTTIINMLLKKYPELKFSVSMTSRAIRKGDIENVSYYFVTKEEFQKKIEENYFYEWAIVHDNYYGTPKDFILENINIGNNVILDIDVQGAKIVKSNLKESVSIFILPPNEDVWINRLMNRGSDTPEVIQKRIKNGKIELLESEYFDHRIVNDDLNSAFNQIEKIIHL